MRIDGRPPATTITWPRGDTLVVVLQFRNKARRNVSRVGCTYIGQIKLQATDDLIDAVAEFAFDTSQAADGAVRAFVSDTGTLTPGVVYFWDIEETDVAMEKRTRAGGTVTFDQDISRAA